MPSENPVLDQSRDLSGRELYRLISLHQVPEWVKSASAEEICGNGLPSHMYADPRRNLYPTHTKAATLTSVIFFLEKQGSFSRSDAELIRERLLKSAEFLGIKPDVDAVIKRAAELSACADSQLSDDDFAYVANGVNGKERRLRMANPLEVKAAAEWLFKYRDTIAFPDRQKIATKVLQKAAQYGAAVGALDDFLEKSAGLGGCSCADAVATVRQRISLARQRHPDVASELEKLANYLEKDPENTRQGSTLCKLAHTLELTDRTLRVEYGGTIRRPVDALFAITRKAASMFAQEHVPTPSGSFYAQEDLGRLRVQQVRDHLGDDVADNVTADGLTVDPEKLAEVLPTFTRGDAEIFDRMASGAGILSRFKEAAAKRQGLTSEDLRAFASSHVVN